MGGQELDQRLIRASIHRPRRHSDFNPVAVLAGEFGARGARLHVKVEDQTAAAATRMWFTTISAT